MSKVARGGYRPRPHINEEPHRRLMGELEAMTDEERSAFLFRISVEAGIYTEDGELTPFYRGELDEGGEEEAEEPLKEGSETRLLP